MQITSAQNSKIKLVNRLRSKRGRQSEGRFVIDYERDLRRALQLGYAIDFLLHQPGSAAAQRYPAVDAYAVPPALLKRASYRENPDDIVAVMISKPAKGITALSAANIRRALVLVELAVPGNIGALLRSADAAGMDAVALVDTALDLYNPNVIRSSAGACFRGNIYKLSSDEALAYFKAEAFQIVAADAAGPRGLYELDFAARSAIALGSEDRGLKADWLNAADQLASIPMAGEVTDSLNVSVSGALFMYEMHRQRRRD